MVSLGEASSVERAIRESPKANALRSFLAGEAIMVPVDEMNEREKAYFSILDALGKNQKKSFSILFEEVSNRKVTEDQPIVYDNFLLFALFVGALKFGENKVWLRQVLDLRKTQNEPEKAITTSFRSLLDGNFLTTDGLPSIVMAGLEKSGVEDIDIRLLKNAFDGNVKINAHVGRDLFLSTIVLYTNSYVISTSLNGDSLRLKKFETVFIKRVKILQNIIYIFILAGLTTLWFYSIKRFPRVKEIANDLGMLLQLIGIGILGYSLNMIKHYFGEWIKKFFGYKNDQTD